MSSYQLSLRVEALAQRMQEVTGDTVEVVVVDQGDTGEQPAAEATAHGIRLEFVTLRISRKDVVLYPRRWMVELWFALMTRFHRLVRDDDCVAEMLAASLS